MNELLRSYKEHRKIDRLVDNKTVYNAEHGVLTIFETSITSENILMTFDYPIIARMLTGVKRLYIDGEKKFDFIAGESLIIPKGKEIIVDSPIATSDHPNVCLALEIDSVKINDVVDRYNQETSIDNNNNNWELDASSFHITNNNDINMLLNRMLTVFTNNGAKSNDLLLDLMIQELIIRLLQTKAKSIFCNDTDSMFNDTRIGYVINFIRKNLTNVDLTVDILAEKAYMSTSHFHKKFKATIGVSPIEFVNTEKIKFAKKLIKENINYQISEIAYKSGFNNTSYFNRQFKKNELITPQQFKKSILS